MTMNKDLKIYVAGHRGMVGSAIVTKLDELGYKNIVVKSRSELDITNQKCVSDFFAFQNIDVVILAAAKVGGIQANSQFPAEFIYENLMIEANIINSSYVAGVKKLLFLGSSCIYPRYSKQPMTEDQLLTGVLEPTNEPYAIAKIAGIKLCEAYNKQYGLDYRSVMPTNLYGPNDNFHPENSHVLPALMQRFHNAKQNASKTIVVWGTGKPKREFLHVDDMAAASLHILQLDKAVYQQHTEPMLSHINVGSGVDISIRELATKVAETVGYQGEIVFDATKPDGTPKKLLDVSRMEKLGWRSTIVLEDGLRDTYAWFLKNIEETRNYRPFGK